VFEGNGDTLKLVVKGSEVVVDDVAEGVEVVGALFLIFTISEGPSVLEDMDWMPARTSDANDPDMYASVKREEKDVIEPPLV